MTEKAGRYGAARLATPIALTLLAAACGSDGSASPDAAVDRCAGVSQITPYKAGLKLQSESNKHSLVFVDADPAPPFRGENRWKVRVLDSSDKPVDGASVRVAPTMPTHGHGTTPASFDGVAKGDGVYELPPIDLFMPGPWQNVFTIDDGGARDRVSVWFCIDA